jgi:hypothetical protein
MSSRLSQTVVVGVGEAGINVLAALAASDGAGWGVSYDDRFEYVAVAAEPTTIEQAPASATEVRLITDSESVGDARSVYPYLPSAHTSETEEARQQRPIGRYTLDSQDGKARDALKMAMERVFDTLFLNTDDGQSQSCNVVHVYAMDGGIGSGTFPFVTHVINEATDHLSEQYGISTYTAGVGMVPKLSYGVGSGFEYVVQPGERWRYANTYAALRDLEMITRSGVDDPLPIYFHSEQEHGGSPGFVLGDSDPHNRIDSPPYHHYFIVDYDGHQSDDAAGPEEPYTRCVEEVVAAVYGLAALGPEIHSWLPVPTGAAHFSSFGQAQLSLPIEDLRRYCNLDERIKELEKRGDSTAGWGSGGRSTDERVEGEKEIEAKLNTLRSKREAVIKRLTTPRYGPRRSRLALDEQMIRQYLTRETLETKLTSLSAFHDAGYLTRDLQTVMESRLSLASVWQSRFLTWSEEKEDETVGHQYNGHRDVWMLHSDENTSLPGVDCPRAGRHTFRRSGNGEFPPFADPYTVQFLTYCVEAPLSDLRMYAELDEAAGRRLNTLLKKWDDHRQAFAYPEWYDRNIRQYFNIQTRVELPKLPELDLDSVRIERTGEELAAWLSSHGLASYLWLADEWDRYRGYITTHGTEPVGWRDGLTAKELTYHDMRAVIPNGEPVARWFDGELSWDELLSKVVAELADREGISVAFTDGRPA